MDLTANIADARYDPTSSYPSKTIACYECNGRGIVAGVRRLDSTEERSKECPVCCGRGILYER